MTAVEPWVPPGDDEESPAELAPVDPPGEDVAVPVDAPVDEGPPKTFDLQVLSSRVDGRRPIIPTWLRTWDDFRAAVIWYVKDRAHAAGLHATRSPAYVARLTRRAPAGGWRVLRMWWVWVWHLESRAVRLDAARRVASVEYLHLSRMQKERIRHRWLITAIVGVPVSIGVLVFVLAAPLWWSYLCAAVGVLVLGAVGRDPDRPVATPASVSVNAAPRLTAGAVELALRSLGLSVIKADAVISFPAPICRDGPGWRATIDLPHGATPGAVMDKKPELASGLRRKSGCVWPAPDPQEHAGRLILWVGDKDLASAKQAPWPLAKAGKADLFGPVPFGTDQRGRVVGLTLMFASVVVGAIPRMGKTFSVRLLLLAAALDVIAELHCYDLKGTGDFSALEPVAHAYRAGDDEDDIEYALADLRALSSELRRRTRVIRELPKDVCPENKITPELARRRALGLHQIVVAVDECQRWFEHPKHGKELEALAEDLVRRGPAVGIVAIFATQRADAKSLPTGISGNAVLRFCLKVGGHVANDQVLGTGAHKAGIKATIFGRGDLGIGWLAGEGDEPRIVRTFYVDGPGAERVVTRARAMREKAGTLSGYCVGEADPNLTPAARALDDMRTVFATAQVDRLASDQALSLLSALRPAVYGSWTPEALAAALRPDGVAPGQVWIDGANQRGYRLEAVNEALRGRQIEG